MKFCYVDESGCGSEKILVMSGILTDTKRMEKTKKEWKEFLKYVSVKIGRPVSELHTCDLYSGNKEFRGIPADIRKDIISQVISFVKKRKDHIFFSVIEKSKVNIEKYSEFLNDNLINANKTPNYWRIAGLHLVLQIQKYAKTQKGTKGNTFLVFDQKDTDFVQVVKTPPIWSNYFYNKKPREEQLSSIIDLPVFANSQDIVLLNISDCFAYIIRRYFELNFALCNEKYKGEKEQFKKWFYEMKPLFSPSYLRYPKIKNNKAVNFFNSIAPQSI